MKVAIIKIGNSQGIRLPKALLRQCNIGKAVNITVEDGAIILEPITSDTQLRIGWDSAFEKMAQRGDDALLDGAALELPSDAKDWQW